MKKDILFGKIKYLFNIFFIKFKIFIKFFLNLIDSWSIKFVLTIFSTVFVLFFTFFTFKTSAEISKLNNSIKTKNTLNLKKIKLKNKIKKMTAGYPINNMSSYISSQDEKVAAFLIAIAKKESNWGKRTPKLNGKECYNYWGFRKKRNRMGTNGHTCFDSKKDAVLTVSKRIENLLAQGIDTPEKMILWKCGYSCKSQNPQNVKKWINDVRFYYNKF